MAIRVLPAQLIDQIAAGEVLERPAHLIKELVENSIDAGATEIEIEFDRGGQHVRVEDDGCGMSREDLGLALCRHATSKISVSEDLFNISSFGFRGEALASIAAVSRLAIVTRLRAEPLAHVLNAEFGNIDPLTTQSAKSGTSITVDGLFENVPARLKFLKSDSAEAAQIKQVLRAIALAHPNIQIRVRSKGEMLFFWPRHARLKERAEAVLDFKPFFSAEGEEDGVQVRSLLGSPDQTLQQNRGIWIFVQDRWVQDRALTAAIMESYRNLLMHGEYPQVILSIHVLKDFVDVNVHPTKSQVKFVDSQKVFRAVVHVLRSALEKAPWVQAKTELRPAQRPQVSKAFEDLAFAAVQYKQKTFPLAEVRDALATYQAPPQPSSIQNFWSQMEIIGQTNLTYIVAQSQSEFYLVDQHAAHERIVFERLMAQWKLGRFDSQTLLLPLVIDLARHEMEVIEAEMANLNSLGLSLEKLGPESLAVSAIPSFVSETAVAKAVKDLTHDFIQNGGSFAWEKRVGDVFASMACHSVVRAGQSMSVDEMRSLLRQMDEFPLSTFCPHGRPVSVSWGFAELERKFGRMG